MLPECAHAVPPAGSTQYCTRSGAPARSLSLAQAMIALPPESTATDGPGGWMSNGVAMLTGGPAATAPLANISVVARTSTTACAYRRSTRDTVACGSAVALGLGLP